MGSSNVGVAGLRQYTGYPIPGTQGLLGVARVLCNGALGTFELLRNHLVRLAGAGEFLELLHVFRTPTYDTFAGSIHGFHL